MFSWYFFIYPVYSFIGFNNFRYFFTDTIERAENGEIAEEGSPDELMEKKGVYYKLYMLQSEAMKKVLSGM